MLYFVNTFCLIENSQMEVDNQEASTSSSVAVTEPMEGSPGRTNDELASETSQTTTAMVKSDLNSPWLVQIIIIPTCC